MTVERVVVVGGGITGLTTAFTLIAEAEPLGISIDVTVLEASATVGGHAGTVREDGFVVEAGPNGFLDREPETLALVESLGLTSRLIEARPGAARRFIVRGRRLLEAPDSVASFVMSQALSWAGKFRLLLEPFAAAPPEGVDETVFQFASRRIGVEAAEMLVDAAVSGISAGDSRSLSVRAHFPRMLEMERQHGGLIRALVARRRLGIKASRLLSFDQGLGTITQALAGRLGRRVRCGQPVCGIDRLGSAFVLTLDDGSRVEADRVVLAVSARAAARLVRRTDRELSESLGKIEYSGVAVVALAYPVSALQTPLEGYGYLVTRGENLATLGVVWESSLFSGRAPEGYVLLRVFMGGVRHPDIVERDESALTDLAHAELSEVMGLNVGPTHKWVFRWPQAIAQYTLGHIERAGRIREQTGRHAGLGVCGTSYDGVSFNEAVASGRGQARAILTSVCSRKAPEGAPRSRLMERV